MEAKAILDALRASWFVETGRHWLPESPARG